ncbi:MAG: radical SAM protein [Promethearchaeota archaeon]
MPIWTVCPRCLRICEGSLRAKSRDVYLVTNCPEHGRSVRKYFDDAAFFNELRALVNKNKRDLRPDFHREVIEVDHPEKLVTSLHVYITYRCNLKCPNCFANSGSGVEPDVPLEKVVEWLAPFEGWKEKPMLVLIGGEPTVREDLPEVVQTLTEMGYNVRMATNGLRLLDPTYMSDLVERGLKWIILQFDGFKPETSRHFRGMDLIEKKSRVINEATRQELKVHLATMVAKDENLDEIYKVLQYAYRHPGIFGANLYPLSAQGRVEESSVSMVDIMKALEEQSGGTISRRDFLQGARLWNLAYRLTGNPIFRQKLCDFRFFLFREEGRLYPINRLFKLREFVKHPLQRLKLLLKLPRLFRWASTPTRDFLYFNIEKFFDSDAIDLEEAYHCHNLFLTEDGIVPFCIFNTLYRPDLANCKH